MMMDDERKKKVRMFPALSTADIAFISRRGMSRQTIEEQWRQLGEGAPFLPLVRPCAVDDGIIRFSAQEVEKLAASYDKKRAQISAIKFVPASGAASRMFAHWQSALNDGGFGAAEANQAFLQSLRRYAFYPLLCEKIGAQEIDKMKAAGNVEGLLKAILSPAGLGYFNTPKALVAFHRYGGAIGTPIEEHLREAAHYCADNNNSCRIHFTIAEEHRKTVEAFLDETLGDYERILGVKFLVDISVQSPATDTIALDENGELARSPDGAIIFRPGGHGALLKNLQGLRADIIFIKNIDNIAHFSRMGETIKYKKALAGLLLDLLAKRREHLAALRKNHSAVTLDEASNFCAKFLNHRVAPSFHNLGTARQAALLADILTRPLRVCGVVRNEGEPGGAPFWVDDGDGASSPQIVEGFQVDDDRPEQKSIWLSAEYFNPVDIVCSITDEMGGVFDLQEFVNKRAVSVTSKIDGGRILRVLELPGLWNGSMSRWNSVFAEMPLATFNPVKIIDDLLRPFHQE